VHPGECTQLTYHYFGPCYWHLGMRGLWRGDAGTSPTSPTAAALEGANPSPAQTHMRRQRSAGARRRGAGAAHPAPAPGAAGGGAPPVTPALAGAAAEAGRTACDAPACDLKPPAGEEQQPSLEQAAAGQEPAPGPLARAAGSVEEPMAEAEAGSGSEDGDADEAASPAPEPEPSTCSGGVLSAVAAAVFSAMGSLGRGAAAPAAAAAAPAAAAADSARPLPQPPAGPAGGGEAGGGPAPRPAEGHCRARGPGGSFRRRPRKRRGGAAAAGAGAPEPAVTAQAVALSCSPAGLLAGLRVMHKCAVHVLAAAAACGRRTWLTGLLMSWPQGLSQAEVCVGACVCGSSTKRRMLNECVAGVWLFKAVCLHTSHHAGASCSQHAAGLSAGPWELSDAGMSLSCGSVRLSLCDGAVHWSLGGQRRGAGLRRRARPQVLATRTTVDVHWQDGRHARGAPAAAHAPCEHLDDHDFWPDDFVEEKPAVDDLDEDGAARP